MTNHSNISFCKDEVVVAHSISDYSEILKSSGLQFGPSEYYWQVGEINKTQGWIIHLSVIAIQLEQLMHKILPELMHRGIPFKIVRDFETACHLLDGSLGSINLGKMVSIYPNNDEDAISLAQKLIGITKQFRGPVILTDVHLGSIVYTRHGSFKPIYTKGSNGLVKMVYNDKGELAPDLYHIPFLFPQNISWPFHKIASPPIPKHPKLLNYAYYPIAVLKPDAKGDVIKALYFKRFWRIRSCIIKQGRLNMFVDAQGRDIQDRLKWQNEIYQDLFRDIPMPKVFDFFFENGDCYLAMEYIKGVSFNKWMSTLYKNRTWLDLSLKTKTIILNKFLEVHSIITTLHKKGYIHRDITSENFLIDKNGKIFLIDMELAYNFILKKPSSPFKLGTAGFMSPEQLEAHTPTIQEDIYALGAFLLHLFTNLFPAKFYGQLPQEIKRNVIFFTGEEKIADLLLECLSIDPHKRPSLSAIESTLKGFREDIWKQNTQAPAFRNITISQEEINNVVQSGINGLASDALVLNCHWFSRRPSTEKKIGNAQMETNLYEGWHTGMSGPLWLLASAKKTGFSTASCEDIFAKSWEYIKKQLISENSTEANPGLFMGKAGIALTMTECISSNLLRPDSENTKILAGCFDREANGLCLSDGIAGQGIALLQASPWLKHMQVQRLLDSYIKIINDTQQNDGSWRLSIKDNKFEATKGLGDTEAGIAWFLLSYLKFNPENILVKKIVVKSLKRLLKKCSIPDPGTTLLFIRAFELLGNSLYKQKAEEFLDTMHSRPVLTDFTLSNGMAGLGEMYLEGSLVFNENKWKERSDWIARLLCSNFVSIDENAGYWMPDETTLATADLFRGVSGILHFLLRYNFPDQFHHPLWPSLLINQNKKILQSGETENL